jgi:hypothetical protein
MLDKPPEIDITGIQGIQSWPKWPEDWTYKASVAVRDGLPSNLKLPRSDIFYIRFLLWEKFGRLYTTSQVEKLLKDEGIGP